MTLVAPETCRFCGCHGGSCTLPDGEKCGWMDHSCTVCSARGCQLAEARRKNAARAARPLTKKEQFAALLRKGWGWGAARDEVFGPKPRRARSGGKGRAA